VQKIVRGLERKANVWPFLVVDTNGFGVTGFLLMVKTRTGMTPEVSEEMWKIPYCGRVYRVYGSKDLLGYFNIPSGNETFIHEFGSQLKRAGIIEDFLWYRIREFHYGFNPRYYSPGIGEWNVYWDEWGLWLKEYLSTRAWHGALRDGDETSVRHVNINKLDLQIINMLRMNARYAFSEIGHKIGVSGAYVGQRVRRLLDQEVIQPRIASFRIGLDDAVWIILDCDDETLRALVSAFNELPMWQGFSVKGDVNGLAAIMYVPTGEVQELFRVFDKYLIEPRLVNDYSFHVIEKWTGIRRWLPIQLYSNEKGWLFEGPRYIEELKKNIASIKL
jgi:DNA-binding Lrp family transcriptional regulator